MHVCTCMHKKCQQIITHKSFYVKLTDTLKSDKVKVFIFLETHRTYAYNICICIDEYVFIQFVFQLYVKFAILFAFQICIHKVSVSWEAEIFAAKIRNITGKWHSLLQIGNSIDIFLD